MYDNVLKCKILYVSGLTGPPSGTEQLYKTMVQPFCNPQYVELSQVSKCMSTGVGTCTVTGTACGFQCVHRENLDLRAVPVTAHISIFIFIYWRTFNSSAYWGWQKSWTIVLYNLRPLTMEQLSPKHVGFCVLKPYRICNEVYLQYDQTDAPVSLIIYSCKTLYMFRTIFPSIIRSSKLHIWQQLFDICLLPYVQFWAPWWLTERPSETCRAFYKNK